MTNHAARLKTRRSERLITTVIALLAALVIALLAGAALLNVSARMSDAIQAALTQNNEQPRTGYIANPRQ